jgi:tRNA(fMet)-specific endonuclease VapC
VILLDTDVVISLLRGNRAIADRVGAASGGASISFMTVGELFYGAEKSAKPWENRGLVERFLLTVPVIESGRASMRLFGALKAGLEARGERLADADILVASIALSRDLILATGNLKHFSRIDGLKAENWILGEGA